MKDSLGGNTNTSMIACISLHPSAYEETINTLKYAKRAKRIKHQVHKNVKDDCIIQQSQFQSIIAALKDEIKSLKTQLKANNQTHSLDNESGDKLLHNDKEIKNINEQLIKTQEQKVKLEQELKATKCDNKLSPTSNSKDKLDCEVVDYVSQNLLSNFEENWEIKQSITELEQLKNKNIDSLNKLKESLKTLNDDAQLTTIKKEMSNLLQNMASNEKIHKEMQAALEDNLFQKQKLQSKLMRIQNGKRRDMLELQIVIRMLKLQKLDLEVQNLEMKKENIYVNKQKSEQEDEVTKMKEQLNIIPSKLKKLSYN